MKKLHKYRHCRYWQGIQSSREIIQPQGEGRMKACVNHAVSCAAEMDTKAQAWYDEADINQRKNSKTIV